MEDSVQSTRVSKSYSKKINNLFSLLRDRLINHSDTALSDHLASDLLPASEQLWLQMRPQLKEALDVEFSKLLQEWNTLERLSELERLKEQYANSDVAWNYSGKPREDVRDLADVTAKSIQPRFEEMYKEAQTTTSHLTEVYQNLQDQLKSLDTQIQDILEDSTTQIQQFKK